MDGNNNFHNWINYIIGQWERIIDIKNEDFEVKNHSNMFDLFDSNTLLRYHHKYHGISFTSPFKSTFHYKV